MRHKIVITEGSALVEAKFAFGNTPRNGNDMASEILRKAKRAIEQHGEEEVDEFQKANVVNEIEDENMPEWVNEILEAIERTQHGAGKDEARDDRAVALFAVDRDTKSSTMKAVYTLTDVEGVQNRYIFTFGFGQKHANGYIAIQTESAQEARHKMCEMYGSKWSMMYESEEDAGVERFGLKLVREINL